MTTEGVHERVLASLHRTLQLTAQCRCTHGLAVYGLGQDGCLSCKRQRGDRRPQLADDQRCECELDPHVGLLAHLGQATGADEVEGLGQRVELF